MAPVRAVLGALWTSTRRNRKSLVSFSGNNLYYVGFGLLFMQDPWAFVFFLIIIGLVLFFPLTSDPLRKIPPDRLALWPLGAVDHIALRIASVCLNPLMWIFAALLVWKRLSIGLWALLLGLFTAGFMLPRVQVAGYARAYRALPNFPGPLNQLIRKNLREMLSTLDIYAGLIVAVPALMFRLAGLMPQAALVPLTLLILLTISTCGQNLFGLEGEPGFTRNRLLPIRGWQILIAKDIAFLIFAVIFTFALAPSAGFAAALMVLATGRHPSISLRRGQLRWRFQMSASFGNTVLQIVAMILAGTGTVYATRFILVPCVGAYVASTWWFGRLLEQSYDQ